MEPTGPEDMRDMADRPCPSCQSITICPACGAHIQVLPSPEEEGAYVLRPSSYVGAVNIGDLAVVIRPKIPIDRVMFLIAYSMDPKHWRRNAVELARDDGILEAIIFAFTHHTRQAIHRGLLRGYRGEDDALNTVRGRIRFGDQIQRPCFIVVCNNTATSKLVYDYISGFERPNEDGTTSVVNGRLALFRNYDEYDNRYSVPRTLLIDSHQLESGEKLSDDFRRAAADLIERFRRERQERTGNREEADKISEQELLREAMNTVGKEGRLGQNIRCVVSVSMLTEGWDASTVTHVLGVRAFGTQLLCEQVVGRALRRQSYELNEDNKFDVEYADVLGIPFDFTARPVVVGPGKPRQTVQVRAVRPERDHLEITFPRVAGYREDPPKEDLVANFTDDSRLDLTPELVGPTQTRNEGIIGEGVDLNLVHTGDLRMSTLVLHLTKRLLETKWRDPNEDMKLHLFGKLRNVVKEWLDNYLDCRGGTYPAQLMYQSLADTACNRITAAITSRQGERSVKALLDSFNPVGSTRNVNFTTSRSGLWTTDARKCHVNLLVLDSDWEAEFCRLVESHPSVAAYVKNHNLGLEVPYLYGSTPRRYFPDFILLVDDGNGDPLHLIVEIKGYRGEDAKEKKNTMEAYWLPGVNALGQHGRWAFAEFTDVYDIEPNLRQVIDSYSMTAIH